MDIRWTTNNTGQPVAFVTPDNGGDYSLVDRIEQVPGVDLAIGLNPIEITFYSDGNVNLAMPMILRIIGDSGHIIGSYTDEKSGARYVP